MEKEKIELIQYLIEDNFESENFFIEYIVNSEKKEIKDKEEIYIPEEDIYEEDLSLPINKEINVLSLFGNRSFIDIVKYEEKPNDINLYLYKLLLMVGQDLDNEKDLSINNSSIIDIIKELQQTSILLSEKTIYLKNKQTEIDLSNKQIDSFNMKYIEDEIKIEEKKYKELQTKYIKLYNYIQEETINWKKNKTTKEK